VARDWEGVASAAGLRQPWGFYLYWAALTTITTACPTDDQDEHQDEDEDGLGYSGRSGALTCVPTVGLMDGTVFREVLLALATEAEAGSPACVLRRQRARWLAGWQAG
jgi:hypothetical protein